MVLARMCNTKNAGSQMGNSSRLLHRLLGCSVRIIELYKQKSVRLGQHRFSVFAVLRLSTNIRLQP
jgi:hypothetical protein